MSPSKLFVALLVLSLKNAVNLVHANERENMPNVNHPPVSIIHLNRTSRIFWLIKAKLVAPTSREAGRGKTIEFIFFFIQHIKGLFLAARKCRNSRINGYKNKQVNGLESQAGLERSCGHLYTH